MVKPTKNHIEFENNVFFKLNQCKPSNYAVEQSTIYEWHDAINVYLVQQANYKSFVNISN